MFSILFQKWFDFNFQKIMTYLKTIFERSFQQWFDLNFHKIMT